MKRIAYGSAGLGILGVLLLLLWGEPVFYGRWVCGLCGHQRRTRQWQIPATSTTLWSSESEEFTPMSRLMMEAGFVHPHAWAFARGSGNGIM